MQASTKIYFIFCIVSKFENGEGGREVVVLKTKSSPLMKTRTPL